MDTLVNTPPLDIVVPTALVAGRQVIIRTLSTLRTCTKNPFRLILVVNQSNVSLPDLVQLLRESGYGDDDRASITGMPEISGFSRASNMGLCYSSAPWVCLLSDDVELIPDWDELLIQHCREGAAIALPSIEESGRANSIDKNPNRRNEVDIACFVCVMFPRSTIENYGLLSMHPALAHLGNDNEYCRRLRRAGEKIVIAGDCCVSAGFRTTIGKLTDAGESQRAEEYLKTIGV